ncbi:hypothetical protein [Flavobacterium sp.]|jgi:hypothetical protein|uniref:hypothetical protein n=1 Tax=Flavobacterium sp. TaxID=239 RepID=UPI0037BF13EF
MYKTEYLFLEPIYQPSLLTILLWFVGVVYLFLVVARIASVDWYPGYRVKAIGKICYWLFLTIAVNYGLAYYDYKVWVKPTYTEVYAELQEESVYKSIHSANLCGLYKLNDSSNKRFYSCEADNNHAELPELNKTIVLYKVNYKDKKQSRNLPWTKEYVQD